MIFFNIKDISNIMRSISEYSESLIPMFKSSLIGKRMDKGVL